MTQNDSMSDFQAMSRRIFRACLAYTVASTLLWVYLIVQRSDGGVFFRKYTLTAESIVSLVVYFLVFWILWSYLFYRLKRFLLKKLGMSSEELAVVFSNRREGFDLQTLLERYPERKIRVIDMIGRRGRSSLFAILIFTLYLGYVRAYPGPESLAFGIENNYFEAVLFSWWTILTYGADNILGRISYGAHSRIMDGQLGRANVLFIGTLWNLFRFVMIPIGIQLGALFPEETYAALIVFIWISYLLSDTAGEVVGSMMGRHSIRVLGVGEVNRKSPAGTVAVFVTSLVCCLLAVFLAGLSPSWILLAIAVSISNTILELFSPRATDDFTMASANALLCWLFGALVF